MRETIFLSGTEEMVDLLSEIQEKLKIELGYDIFFYKKKFPLTDNDPIEACLKNIIRADRFILVVGNEFGTVYENGKFIIEKELEIAIKEVNPITIFFREEIDDEIVIIISIRERNYFPKYLMIS